MTPMCEWLRWGWVWRLLPLPLRQATVEWFMCGADATFRPATRTATCDRHTPAHPKGETP